MNQLNKILIAYLTIPESTYYLPKIVRNAEDPTLEPFELPLFDAGEVSLMGISTRIVIRDLLVQGISNIQIAKNSDGLAEVAVIDDTVTFIAVRPNTEEVPLPTVPKDLIMTGALVLESNGVQAPSVPITINVKSGILTGIFTASGDFTDPDSINVTFTNLQLHAEATPENISVDLSQLHSVFQAQVSAFLQNPKTLSDLLTEINIELGKPPILNAVSSSATAAAKAALREVI